MVNEDTPITRRDMGKIHHDVQTLVMHLVNNEGIKWRAIDTSHILLYPPDGVTRPFKVSAARPSEPQLQHIERQFMAVHGIKDADGNVPGQEEVVAEAPVVEKGIWGPGGDPAEAVRTLAAALGVSLGGTVSEEDYLAVVAEKDFCQTQAEGLRRTVEQKDEEIDAISSNFAAMTAQRDDLLKRVHDLEDDIAQACGLLARNVKS